MGATKFIVEEEKAKHGALKDGRFKFQSKMDDAYVFANVGRARFLLFYIWFKPFKYVRSRILDEVAELALAAASDLVLLIGVFFDLCI